MTDEKLKSIHEEALKLFNEIQAASFDERILALQDRRFYSIAGAQWEDQLGQQFENKPKLESNKIHLAVIRIINEYRNNPIGVEFTSKTGEEDDMSDTSAMLYRSDESASCAQEAYDNAFEEALGGGFGAWRLRAEYEDEEDPENDEQRIRIEPIFDADSCVFFDLDAKRQDKSDAKHCFVLSSIVVDAYIETYGDDPSTWPRTVQNNVFDWVKGNTVYIAEYYRVEEKNETRVTYKTLLGEEEKYDQSDFDEDPSLLPKLNAIGSVEVRRKKYKKRRVHKYVMSGFKVLEDCKYIAGCYIPIIPVYGKRWYVDGIERFMGHVRLAKDLQRVKNIQLSKTAEIGALSAIEKPILTPEQIKGHQLMWADDNIKNYPYLLINPVRDANGNPALSAPLGYTRPPQLPPALTALIQLSESDMQDILGSPQQGEKIVSNIGAKTVEMVQQRLDMQTFIYVSNFAKGMRRSAEVWLSMAKELYLTPGRKMKGEKTEGFEVLELMQPFSDKETGDIKTKNDFSRVSLDVTVNVGPSSTSRRSATVNALTSMLAVTKDPETAKILNSLIISNMDGEGLKDVRDYYRKQLVTAGVIRPTEKEKMEMMAAEQKRDSQQDPNSLFLTSMAEEATAKAAKARADTVNVIADAKLKEAKTQEIAVNLVRDT